MDLDRLRRDARVIEEAIRLMDEVVVGLRPGSRREAQSAREALRAMATRLYSLRAHLRGRIHAPRVRALNAVGFVVQHATLADQAETLAAWGLLSEYAE